MIDALDRLGRWGTTKLANFGDFWRFAWATLVWFLRGVTAPRNAVLILPQAYFIGVRSVFVVGVTGGFIGMILAVQTIDQFAAVGLEESLGGVINLTVVRELGPALGAMMLAGRVGGGLAAELGTMTVTEQVDALRVMGTDPIRFLVVPRVLACAVLTPFLIMVANWFGVMGGALVCTKVFQIPEVPYWQNSQLVIESWDLWMPMIKSFFFGLAIGLISCYKGFQTKGGAEGVGQACTEAFVASFISILVLDFLLNLFLMGMYQLLYGVKPTFG